MTPSQKDLRLLYQRSGNRCAFPGCGKVLDAPASDIDPAVILSDVAHIVGEKLDGPRGHFSMPLEDRDGYDNLILLCQEHHRTVDQQPQFYTIDRLRQFKKDHEARVREAMGDALEAHQPPCVDADWVTDTVFSTLLPVLEMPPHVYKVPCQYDDSQARAVAQQIISPDLANEICPFILRGGNLICFHDLHRRDGPFRNLVDKQWDQVKQYESRAWWGDPDRERWFVELLNRSLNKLTGRKKLNWDKYHKRYYFDPPVAGQPMDITYHPMNQSTTERHVVWQPITKKTGLPKPYWLHQAVALQFHRVTKQDWCLSIRPELRVTRDGKIPLESEKVGARVTRRKSRMFNYDVLKEVHFWRDFLSGSQPRIIMAFGSGQHIVISTTMMQTEIHWPGTPTQFAKPFANVEYEEDLFSLAALDAIELDGDIDDLTDLEDEEGAEDKGLF